MIRSMTGYASQRSAIQNATLTVEIKSLNHKSQDIHIHCPRLFSMLEIPIRERAQSRIRRGRLEVYLRLSGSLDESETIRANIETARAYRRAAQEIADALVLPYEPRVQELLGYSGVIETEDNTAPSEEVTNQLFSLLDQALDQVIIMKENEGQRLMQELDAQLEEIIRMNERLAVLRPQVMEEYREKLMNRIQEWQENLDIDPNRIAQEVAFFADRSDIQEETVRLQSHVEEFRKLMCENADQAEYKPIGRRLDFLCQELFREANTIGSKSSHVEVSQAGLKLKSTIEQLREQVQNIE